MTFSIDEWMQLALDNPVAFEAHRKEVINNTIERLLPSLQHKLKGLQFRIDMERRRARTPMASCLKLSEIMLNYFYEEHVPSINYYLYSSSHAVSLSSSHGTNADILSFPQINK